MLKPWLWTSLLLIALVPYIMGSDYPSQHLLGGANTWSSDQTFLGATGLGLAPTAGAFFSIVPGEVQRDLITSVGLGLNIVADSLDVNILGNGETVAVGTLAYLGIPTWTSTGTTYTITEAATLFIEGPPVASTNVTISSDNGDVSTFTLLATGGRGKFQGTNTPNVLELENIGTTTRGALMQTIQGSATSAEDADNPFRLLVRGDNASALSTVIAEIAVVWDDVTSSTMDSHMAFCVQQARNGGNCNITATLSGAGAWTDAPSFAELKTYETNLTNKQVIAKLRTLSVGRFRHVGAPDLVDVERHIGPTADAFYNAFKAGLDPRVMVVKDKGLPTEHEIPQYGIAARDVAGVALMAIQELIKENDELKTRVDVLEGV